MPRQIFKVVDTPSKTTMAYMEKPNIVLWDQAVVCPQSFAARLLKE